MFVGLEGTACGACPAGALSSWVVALVPLPVFVTSPVTSPCCCVRLAEDDGKTSSRQIAGSRASSASVSSLAEL